MKGKRLEVSAWGMALILVFLGGLRWVLAPPIGPALGNPIPHAGAMPDSIAADTLHAAAQVIVADDLFRLARAPSEVRYQPDRPREPARPPPPKPTLTLSGILGGPPWQAVVLGLPNREGSVVVSEGETVEGFLVRRVTRDSVVITGADTTWVLTVSGTWR